MSLIEAFHEGGWFMYVVVLVALVATGAGLLGAALAFAQQTRQPALLVSLAAVVLGILVPVTGGIGYALAMRTVYGVIDVVDAPMRAQVLAQGISEAMNLIAFGVGCALPPLLLGVVGTLRAATRPVR